MIESRNLAANELGELGRVDSVPIAIVGPGFARRRQAGRSAELEKLAKLRDEGVISSNDFEAKKKQLLGI